MTILIRNNSDLWRINDLIPKIQTIKTDLSDYEKLEKIISDINPNFVYHLGAYGGYPFQTNIEKITQVNIVNTINLFESLSKCNNLKLIVNFGSSSEYGIKAAPMNENDQAMPVTPYGISKLTQTKFAKFYSKASHEDLRKKVTTLTSEQTIYFKNKDKNRQFNGKMSEPVTNKLTCESQQKNELFIFSDSTVWPCTHMKFSSIKENVIVNREDQNKKDDHNRYINNLKHFSLYFIPC